MDVNTATEAELDGIKGIGPGPGRRGEEFAAVLPGVSPTEAQAIAERVRSAVERQALDATQGGPQRATVSIGLVHSATLGADADMDTLLLAADTALYRAKAEGRNRVMVG